MREWVLQGLFAAWTRLGQRRDLLLEFIVLRHQLAVLQRTGTLREIMGKLKLTVN